MTLTDNSENSTDDKNMAHTSFALRDALQQAVKEDRITIGGYQCAKQMQGRSERFSFCVFPEENTKDDMTNIERILLEAYCREHRIRIVRVDDAKKLGKMLSKIANKRFDRNTDYTCVLVERQRNNTSTEEASFMEYHRQAMKTDPWHVTEVPS